MTSLLCHPRPFLFCHPRLRAGIQSLWGGVMDSRFRGNDGKEKGNDREDAGMTGMDAGMTGKVRE